MLLSKSVICSQNVLIFGVDVHLNHISQPVKFQCHIISISGDIADLLQIFGASFGSKTSNSPSEVLECPDEAQKCGRWVLVPICTYRVRAEDFGMGL